MDRAVAGKKKSQTQRLRPNLLLGQSKLSAAPVGSAEAEAIDFLNELSDSDVQQSSNSESADESDLSVAQARGSTTEKNHKKDQKQPGACDESIEILFNSKVSN